MRTYSALVFSYAMDPVSWRRVSGYESRRKRRLGAFIVSTFKMDGNTLTIAQQRNQSGPYANPVTSKLGRVE